MYRLIALAGGFAVIQDPAKVVYFKQMAANILTTAGSLATALTGVQLPPV